MGRLVGRGWRDGDGDGETLWHDLPIASGTPGLFVVHVHCGGRGRETWWDIKGRRTKAGETKKGETYWETHDSHRGGGGGGHVEGRRTLSGRRGNGEGQGLDGAREGKGRLNI